MASHPPQEQQQHAASVSSTRSAATKYPATAPPTTEPTSSSGRNTDDMNQPRSQSSTLSTAYNLVMTPVNLITFLLSLVLIDLRYSLQRQHSHSASRSRLPVWLHTLLFRPYENPRTRASSVADGRWYYHTKQKKLFKMEADEAFRFRGTMLFALAIASIGGLAGLWFVIRYLAQLLGKRLY